MSEKVYCGEIGGNNGVKFSDFWLNTQLTTEPLRGGTVTFQNHWGEEQWLYRTVERRDSDFTEPLKGGRVTLQNRWGEGQWLYRIIERRDRDFTDPLRGGTVTLQNHWGEGQWLYRTIERKYSAFTEPLRGGTVTLQNHWGEGQWLNPRPVGESDYAIIKRYCALMRLCAVKNDSARKWQSSNIAH